MFVWCLFRFVSDIRGKFCCFFVVSSSDSIRLYVGVEFWLLVGFEGGRGGEEKKKKEKGE